MNKIRYEQIGMAKCSACGTYTATHLLSKDNNACKHCEMATRFPIDKDEESQLKENIND